MSANAFAFHGRQSTNGRAGEALGYRGGVDRGSRRAGEALRIHGRHVGKRQMPSSCQYGRALCKETIFTRAGSQTWSRARPKPVSLSIGSLRLRAMANC